MAFADVARLLASLDLDTKPFERGARSVGGDLGRIESGMGRVSTRTLALGTAIGTGIERIAEKGIGFLFSQVQQGEEALRTLQTTQAQTAAVIESTGGKAGVSAAQVREYAESLESVTTADDKAIQQGENLLLTFTGIGKEAFPSATKSMVDLAIAMNKGNAETADFDSAAIQLGKALNDPIKGITALSRVGVSFTDQQKKQIETLVKSGDTLGAQKVILKELETEFGKAGEAAGKSGAAGIVRLNDAVEDAQLALAQGLSPALEEIRADITTALSDPKTQTDIRNLGRFLGDAARQGLTFARSIPWDQVADGLKTAAGFAGKLIDVFVHLPPGVQATILSLVALKKLGGGGIIKVGVDILGEGAQSIFKGLFQRGSSPANPMFVQGTELGGGAGGVAAKSGLGLASKLFLVGEAIGLIAAVNEVRDNISTGLRDQATDIHESLTQNLTQNAQTTDSITAQLAAVNDGIRQLEADPLAVALVTGPALDELKAMREELQKALVAEQTKPPPVNAAQERRESLTPREALQIAVRAQHPLITEAKLQNLSIKELRKWVADGTKRTIATAKDASEKAKRQSDVLRDRIESNKTATIARLDQVKATEQMVRERVDATRSAVQGVQQVTGTVRSGVDIAADRIVSAIFAAQTNVNVVVQASAGISTQTATFIAKRAPREP